jgi:site-specific recombinase XerD
MNIGNYTNQLSKSIRYKRYSEHTVSSYVAQIEKFLRYFQKEATKPSEISAKQITEYLGRMNNHAGHKAALCAIKYFYAEVGHQPRKLDNVKFPKKNYKLPIVLSQEEIQRMFTACQNTKHKVILTLLYATGLRVSELLNLKWEHIDRSRMVINVIQGKGKKDRQVMLPETIIPLLSKYWYDYKPKQYVLNGQFTLQYSQTSVLSVVKDLARRAGITKDVYTHLIRHCSFTHMYENGVDIYSIQKLAGHSSAKTTAIYTHISHNVISRIQSPIANINL